MRIGQLGRIASGKDQSSFVLVKDDSERTGGFLILIGAKRDFSGESFDYWVETREDLEGFAEESNWVIEWQGDDVVP
jgi:hypothetical protein